MEYEIQQILAHSDMQKAVEAVQEFFAMVGDNDPEELGDLSEIALLEGGGNAFMITSMLIDD